MKWRTASALAVIALVWGSAWIPTSDVLKEVPALSAGAVRFAIAAAFTSFLALIARHRAGRTTNRISPTLFLHALILSIAALALPYALIVWASGEASPAAVPVLFAFMPLAAFLLGREVVSTAIPALVVGIGGVALLVAQGLSISRAQLKPVCLITCAVLLGAFSLNYAKKHLRTSDLLPSSAVQFALAAVLLGVISAAAQRGQSLSWSQWDRGTLLSLSILGLAVSGVTLPLMYWLVTRLETWQVATLQWTSTLVSVAEAAWFLRAKPSLEQGVGAVLIIGATAWLLGNRSLDYEAVTPKATNSTIDASTASESEVGSK